MKCKPNNLPTNTMKGTSFGNSIKKLDEKNVEETRFKTENCTRDKDPRETVTSHSRQE